MNKKKLIGNLLLIAFVVGLGLSFVDFRSGPDSFEDSIQSFIYDRLEDNGESLHYSPLTFEEIDESFLLAKKEILDPLQVVADSMQNQLQMMINAANGIEYKNTLNATKSKLQGIGLENIAELLRLDARLKREAKRADKLNEEERAALYEEETRMMNAINELNAALGTYNLSVFNIDFKQTETKRYFHTFLLSEGNSVNISSHTSVFELNTEDKAVISFKEI